MAIIGGRFLAGVLLTGLVGKPALRAQDPAGPVPVPDSGKSIHFGEVTRHLDLGGLGFGYLDVDGDIDGAAKVMNELLVKASEMAGDRLPPEVAALDFRAMASELGISGIDAIGFSSFDAGDVYRNKVFVRAAGGRKGLLKMLGGRSGEFGAKALAPAGTDLVIERDLNLAAGYQMARRFAKRFGGAEGEAAFDKAMAGAMADFGVTLGDLFSKFDTKIVVLARADDAKPLAVPDLPVAIPTVDALVSIDNLGWLFDQLLKQLPPEAQAKVQEGEGFKMLEFPPMAPEGDLARYQPIAYKDKKSGRILLASSRTFFDECRGEGARLFAEAEFLKAMDGLPMEGNGLSYYSVRFSRAMRGILTQALESMGGGEEFAAMLPFFKSMLPELEQGLATVEVNYPDGFLVASNSNGSIKELAGPALLVPIAVAASVAVPMFSKIQEKARASKDLQVMKQLAIGLRVHALDHDGAYPEKLSEILPDLEVEPSFLEFLDSGTGESARVWYARGLSDRATDRLVLLAHPYVQSGKRAVIFCDGAGELVEESEFQRLVEEQKPDFEK